MTSLWVGLAGIALAICTTARAQAPELDASLNESVLMVPKKGFVTVSLETTVYRPDGEGPFPIVVINHGKELGSPRFQRRYRPALAARWFLERGYAVVVPMRQGFANSGGGYVGGECNVESNGRVQAEDISAVLDHLATQPWADRSRILVAGQSHGGWTTLAFGTLGYPGVKGLLNFAGGLRQDSCNSWQAGLASAAGSYGNANKLPSLWFYGDNDSFFNRETSSAMFDRYKAGGSDARYIAFGTFGRDAHSMFGSRDGARIWQPEVARFLQQIGMPSEPLPSYARPAAVETARPGPTPFAAYDDEAKVPFLRDNGRAGYRVYLGREMPRAFAIAPNGAWGWANGEGDPLKRALDNCNRTGAGACRLYSVDTDVVWSD